MTNFVRVATVERHYRKRELLVLMSARADFSGAKQAAEMLLTHAPQPGSDLNYPLLVAAIVCYTRPFTENVPYGCLPKRYAKSLPDEVRAFHRTVIEGRHRFFAHSDLNARKAFIYPKGSVVARHPHLLHSGSIGTALGSVLYPPQTFEKLVELSTYMKKLVTRDIDSLLEELYGGLELPTSKFRLKVDNGL